MNQKKSLFKSHKNAEKLYFRTRSAVSRRSMERSKELVIGDDCYHSFFGFYSNFYKFFN